ncbi:MAG: LEA type 2 family protein [Flavobacteriales bacterium]|nr:LEA type 2 family protein [Flavobacteriales bacterium]
MTKKIFRLSFLFSILLFLSSCFKYEEVTIKDIKTVRLIEFSEKGLIVESEIKIDNPNSYKISIINSEFDIFVNNKRLAKAKIDNKISIPKNSSEYHKVILKSDYKDFASGALVNMLALTMSGNDKVKFKVEGFIVGKAFFIKKKVKVNHEDVVPLKLF